jgi:hypothetical protein
MDAFQKQRAEIALRRLESEKDIKRHKLNEHLQNVRLSLLLRLPYSVVKAHNNCHMSVSSVNGMVRMSFPDDYIPIRRFLQRSDSPTFAEWLQVNYPNEYERYRADKFTYLFGYGATTLKYRDAVQVLYDEFDKFTWYRTETERKYYFSSLLADCDVSALDEFALFGSVGGHSAEEIQIFKSELLSMQQEYLKHPDCFFHPSADADSTGAVV